MDVVTLDTDLFNFIENFEKKEDKKTNSADVVVTVSDSSSSSSSTLNNQEVQSGDVWEDISEALNTWTQQILDVESRWNKQTSNFQQTIEESLTRQQLDGFLNYQDLSELRYIARLWINLLQSISCYTVGCTSVRRDIITHLLELHSLQQINSCLFIETCLKL